MNTDSYYPIYNDILDNIANVVAKNKPNSIPQHILISGGTGSGKTTLLQRLKEKLKSEGKHIVSLHFPYTLIHDAETIESKFENKGETTTLLLIDDFHLLLESLSTQEQYRLRAFLFSNGAPTLIATSKKQLDAITDYRAPFYDAFRIFILHPEEHVSNFFDKQTYNKLVKEKNWEEAYSIISNNFCYLASFASGYTNGLSIQECINMELKANSRYFKSLYLSLPLIQQQVILGIALSPTVPTSLIEIRDSAKIESTSITSAIKRLVSISIVKQIGQKKRNYTYALTDALFYKWLSNFQI